jgi:predicted DNA-binding protein with PD1-like motif
MESANTENAVLVRFDRGDIIPDKLVELAAAQDWTSGYLTGIGGVKNVTLAYFDLEQKKYLEFQADGVVELLSLQGNLSLLNNRPFWHLHAIVGDRYGNMRGGHLVRMEVAITLECWIRKVPLRVLREPDPVTNLNFLKLK